MTRKKKEPGDGNYEVGNCKPPTEHRFKKGQPSANPKGRPKGSSKKSSMSAELNLINELFLKTGQKPIKTTRHGVVEQVPRIAAAIEKVFAMGLGGNFPALKKIIEGSEAAYQKDADFQRELLEVAVWYKEKWDPIFADCIKRRVPVPDQVPDPRDVIINADGKVEVLGAVTWEMKKNQDAIEQWRDQELDRVNWAHREPGLEEIIPDLATKLRAARRRIAKCNAYLPPRLRRFPESNAGDLVGTCID